MPRFAHTTLLAMAAISAVSSIACLSGPWPGRPPRFLQQVPAAVPASGQDAELLAGLRKAGGAARYPTKYYFHQAPDWRPTRSSVGIITGRRTANTPVVELKRLDGSPDNWPDLCEIRIIALQQDALDAQASRFAPARSVASSATGEVDCAVYDAAR